MLGLLGSKFGGAQHVFSRRDFFAYALRMLLEEQGSRPCSVHTSFQHLQLQDWKMKHETWKKSPGNCFRCSDIIQESMRQLRHHIELLCHTYQNSEA